MASGTPQSKPDAAGIREALHGRPPRQQAEQGGRGAERRGACAEGARRMLRCAAGPQMRGVRCPASLHPHGGAAAEPLDLSPGH